MFYYWPCDPATFHLCHRNQTHTYSPTHSPCRHPYPQILAPRAPSHGALSLTLCHRRRTPVPRRLHPHPSPATSFPWRRLLSASPPLRPIPIPSPHGAPPPPAPPPAPRRRGLLPRIRPGRPMLSPPPLHLRPRGARQGRAHRVGSSGNSYPSPSWNPAPPLAKCPRRTRQLGRVGRRRSLDAAAGCPVTWISSLWRIGKAFFDVSLHRCRRT